MKDRFEDILSRKLSQIEITPRKDSFEALEASLGATLRAKRRKVLLYRASAVAAACVVALLLAPQFEMRNEVSFSNQFAEVEEAQDVQEIQELQEFQEQASPAIEPEIAPESIEVQETVSARQTPEPQRQIATVTPPTAPTPEPVSEQVEPTPAPTEQAPEKETAPEENSQRQDFQPYTPQAPSPQSTSRTKNDFVANVFVGALANASERPFASTRSASSNYQVIESVSTQNQTSNKVLNNYHHEFPITIGINVGKKLGRGPFSLETGLTYTSLRSSADMRASYSYSLDQHVQYLGIPLRLNYSLLSPNNKLDVYLSAGVAAEVAISARMTTSIYDGQGLASSRTESLDARGAMFSTALHAGLAYELSPYFGLFFEPGVNYYFENDNHPTTYRSDDKPKFDLRIGLRTKF